VVKTAGFRGVKKVAERPFRPIAKEMLRFWNQLIGLKVR
jgi:hypothetical protein